MHHTGFFSVSLDAPQWFAPDQDRRDHALADLSAALKPRQHQAMKLCSVPGPMRGHEARLLWSAQVLGLASKRPPVAQQGANMDGGTEPSTHAKNPDFESMV